MNTTVQVQDRAADTGVFSGGPPALPSRIPSLDGMRAVSILLVVFGHSIPAKQFPGLFMLFGHLGNFGVRIFFLISGFLITTLLLKEFAKTGRISLLGFYARRTLRIFPAFYVYVGVVWVCSLYGLVELYPGDLLHALTYTMNYHLNRGWLLNHTWSLSVEEQFYLLWPAVVLLAAPSKALRYAAGVIVAAPLIRVVMYFGFHAAPTELMRHFQAVADALATGCVLAGAYNWLGRQESYVRLQHKAWYPVIPVLLMLVPMAAYKVQPMVFYLPGQSIVNLGGILFLDWVVRWPGNWAGRILNWKPLTVIGLWSYSIYLWQEFFLDHDPLVLHFSLPWNVIYVFAASIASYYLVERTFLKMRERVSPAKAASGEASRT